MASICISEMAYNVISSGKNIMISTSKRRLQHGPLIKLRTWINLNIDSLPAFPWCLVWFLKVILAAGHLKDWLMYKRLIKLLPKCFTWNIQVSVNAMSFFNLIPINHSKEDFLWSLHYPKMLEWIRLEYIHLSKIMIAYFLISLNVSNVDIDKV